MSGDQLQSSSHVNNTNESLQPTLVGEEATTAAPAVFNGVQIERDYSEGLECKFQTNFPPELTGRVSMRL